MKKEKSISKKINEILIILGTIILLMCVLNVSALYDIANFNTTIGENIRDLVAAYESNNVETILQVQDQIAYTMTHCHTKINGTLIFDVLLVIISTVIIVLTGIALNKIIAKPIQTVNKGIEKITDGDLTVKFNESVKHIERTEKSKDEIICMQESMNNMTKQLSDIIGNVINISDDVSKAMDNLSEGADAISRSTFDISSVVEEVSGGAVSTAEDTQNAMTIVSDVGENINGIKNSTESLSNAAQNMNNAKDNVVSILSEFIEINGTMGKNVADTNEQINITNKNVKGIQKFIEVIKGIASETNLLSLNAQIEASKAGEFGKGFSVVASKIGKLAEQSANASDEIQETLTNLLENYDLIVQKMNMTNEDIISQNTKLNETREHFEILNSDINITVNKIKDINVMVDELIILRNGLVDIISSLSSVSEENAASAQETNASLEELTSVISQMCEDIKNVKDKANILFEKVNVFVI